MRENLQLKIPTTELKGVAGLNSNKDEMWSYLNG